MNVLGIISSQFDPASRFRIKQYGPYLEELGTNLDVYQPSASKDAEPPGWSKKISRVTKINEWRIWNNTQLLKRSGIVLRQFRYDLIWQNRLLLKTYSFLERYYKRPFIFDFDDAIWLLEGEKAVQKALTMATAVFAGNEYLADYANRFNKNVHIIPTCIDTKQLFPLHLSKTIFNIGWIGTPGNFKYLEMIMPALLEFLHENEDAQLTIVSSARPAFIQFDKSIYFIPWSLETENEHINKFSVGLMPLTHDEWTLGKCSCKLLQYLACGIPVLASPVGQNNSIVNSNDVGLAPIDTADWKRDLQTLKDNTVLYNTFAQNGPGFVHKHYSCTAYSEAIVALFNKYK